MSGTTTPIINTRWLMERGLYMGQAPQKATTATPASASHPQPFLHSDSISSTQPQDESQPSTKSGWTD